MWKGMVSKVNCKYMNNCDKILPLYTILKYLIYVIKNKRENCVLKYFSTFMCLGGQKIWNKLVFCEAKHLWLNIKKNT